MSLLQNKTEEFRPELPEHTGADIYVGPLSGDSTRTFVTLYLPYGIKGVAYDKDQGYRVMLRCTGEWEREGLVNALRFLLSKLT